MTVGSRPESAVVVGAGVVGLSCAFHLARSGLQVTVVEAESPGAGSSQTNAGWVVPSMCEPVPSPAALRVAASSLVGHGPVSGGWEPSPRYVAFLARMLAAATPRRFARGVEALQPLATRAVRSFDELADAGVDMHRERRGVVRLFLDRHHLAQESGLAADGAQVLSRTELRQLLPTVGPRVVGGVLSPGDQHVDPASLVSGLVATCRRLGVRFAESTAALRVRTSRQGRPVVEALGGEFCGDVAVLAAGVGTRPLLAASGVRAALRAGKGYGADLADQAGAPMKLRMCAYLAEHRVALTPFAGHLRLAGTMAFGDETSTLDRRRVAALVGSGQAYFDQWPRAGLRLRRGAACDP